MYIDDLLSRTLYTRASVCAGVGVREPCKSAFSAFFAFVYLVHFCTWKINMPLYEVQSIALEVVKLSFR